VSGCTSISFAADATQLENLRRNDDTINAIAGPERLVLRTPTSLYGEGLKTLGASTVAAGQPVTFVLSYAEWPHREDEIRCEVCRLNQETARREAAVKPLTGKGGLSWLQPSVGNNLRAGARKCDPRNGVQPTVILRSSNLVPLMSALGQKQTSADVGVMSALPPKADIRTWPRNVR
jgi:hypothetical protein